MTSVPGHPAHLRGDAEHVVLESCVDSVDSALAAERGGAGRVELCARLDVGGMTPSVDLVAAVVERLPIPVFVMVRPRAGGFVYDAGEARAALREIRLAGAAGAGGIVSGALTRDGTIDRVVTRDLIAAASPLPFTFHRAFDETRDLTEALEVLIGLGAARVLTSGGAATAWQGAVALAALVRRAGGALTVVAGGTVRPPNVAELVRRTGVREVHAHLGGETPADEERAVRELVRALRASGPD